MAASEGADIRHAMIGACLAMNRNGINQGGSGRSQLSGRTWLGNHGMVATGRK
ncbi:MAG: hypothetical protein M3178_08025 [Pseudomonadota bacterium]|nr:hypothetical protein [Pseudomonadota bacterium]